MSKTTPIVFIASTCYDLADLRAELRQHLEKDGFIVRLSDDWDSGFRVNPEVNSIESCLENLRGSDVALFILDRRYGPLLGGKYGDKSATHIEFAIAIESKVKPLFFIRKRTMDEFDLWRGNQEAFKPRWVDGKQCEQLFKFLAEVRDLHNPQGRSNWIDLFEASPDLRLVVTKRLVDMYPALAGGRALTKDRVVRLGFVRDHVFVNSPHFSLYMHMLNAGLNIAVDVTVCLLFVDKVMEEKQCAAVLPVNGSSGQSIFNRLSLGGAYFLVCNYVNLWGDKYEVRAPIVVDLQQESVSLGKEHFRVVEPSDQA